MTHIDKEYLRANVTKEEAVWWLGCYEKYLKQVEKDPQHGSLECGICWFTRQVPGGENDLGYRLWGFFEDANVVFWDYDFKKQGPTTERLALLRGVSDKLHALLAEGLWDCCRYYPPPTKFSSAKSRQPTE